MAHRNDNHTVKLIEKLQVSPPPGSVPSTSLPLTFFDIPWFFCHPIQRTFFYEFPCSTHQFLQTVLPNLTHSLSLTLQHFFPFAANLIIPPKPHVPYIRYVADDSVSFTVADSTADFTHLVTDSPQDVRNWHPLVPQLSSTVTLEDGTRLFPLLAIQVTVFPNSGLSICVTFNHIAGDGRAFHHFMKFWASVCRTGGNITCFEGSLALPFHNRDIIADPKGLKLIYLEELWDLFSQRMEFAGLVHDVSIDKVRATFVLSGDQVQSLKKWVSIKCSGPSHISTFVVTCSLIWVCKAKSELSNFDKATNDPHTLYNLVFVADCSNLSEFSIPSTYFGNCLVSRILSLRRSELLGENGIVEAINAIERQVRDVKSDPLRGAERLMLNYRELAKSCQPVTTIAGSPKLGVYETDFGLGKPKKSELVHIDFSKSISLSDCRNKDGGIEVGLALGKIQMNNFANILEEHLTNIIVSDD